MADSSTYPNTGDPEMGPERGSTGGTPGWVKVSAGVALTLVLLLLIGLVTHGDPASHGGVLH